ncbi:disease resistance protein RGA5-like [Triticum dicoccoides]|uniref:disease resistance protein RGA5-like n=1 Tax=Triticum dicoccoides TaxID=85692 RepID=UPI000E794698|nr:disease resistance protein RGA5-like [Triticum dicoccoides]
MKQKIVIKVSMSCDKSRLKAMTMAARANGVSSVGITGDSKDMLEVVGNSVDPVCLVGCLRKKYHDVHIVKVEEVKDDKKDEKKEDPPPYWYHGYRHPYGPYPPPMVVCDEPTTPCAIM